VPDEPTPPKRLPFPPMEAELVDRLPDGDGWQYEPKWDGFRGILENLDGELHLWSRNARPLLRYFPELGELGQRLPPRSAVDGEIVIERDGALDFDTLQTRLHPAKSRVRKLSAEWPAGFVCFDVLVWEDDALHRRPLDERRAKVEALPFDVSPATRDRGEAERWLARLEVAGFDGVIAKRLELPYMAGSREAVQKVKAHKTADCVVMGVTWSEKGTGIASLMLGLYEDGKLRPVGSASAAGKRREEILARVEPLLGAAPERRPRGEPSRWRPKVDLEWSPVAPELVVEVKYDKWQKARFRHGTRFLRFRPDKDPGQCTVDQVRPRPRRGDPTVPGLLGRAAANPPS
jgi:ATP-dependent DNA ligase